MSMPLVRREVELTVRVSDLPEVKRRVFSTIADRGVTVRAHCAYSDRDQTVVSLVADDAPKVKAVLEDAGFKCQANPVVLVGVGAQVGAVAQLGAALRREGIEILCSYGSGSGCGGECDFAVFKTRDDRRAVQVLAAGLRSAPPGRRPLPFGAGLPTAPWNRP